MSHVDFKKWPCRTVEFMSQGPHGWDVTWVAFTQCQQEGPELLDFSDAIISSGKYFMLLLQPSHVMVIMMGVDIITDTISRHVRHSYDDTYPVHIEDCLKEMQRNAVVFVCKANIQNYNDPRLHTF